MNEIVRDKTAIVGIGRSRFGRFLPESQLNLGATALKEALADSGLERGDIDGLSIHMGWPLGLDYDQVAEGYGLDVRYVNQMWTHGRFIAYTLQHATLAVISGMADVVACVTAISFTRERGILGGPGDMEGMREGGGTPALAVADPSPQSFFPPAADLPALSSDVAAAEQARAQTEAAVATAKEKVQDAAQGVGGFTQQATP